MLLAYRAGYRIKQIFYNNNRSIGCSSMLPAGGKVYLIFNFSCKMDFILVTIF